MTSGLYCQHKQGGICAVCSQAAFQFQHSAQAQNQLGQDPWHRLETLRAENDGLRREVALLMEELYRAQRFLPLRWLLRLRRALAR